MGVFLRAPSGRSFEIKVFYSAKDLDRAAKFADLNSYDQFVNNLARSFHRRITFVEINERTGDGGLWAQGQGVTKCCPSDTFSREYGFELALLRALESAEGNVSATDLDYIAKCLTTKTVAGLVATYRKPEPVAAVVPTSTPEPYAAKTAFPSPNQVAGYEVIPIKIHRPGKPVETRGVPRDTYLQLLSVVFPNSSPEEFQSIVADFWRF